MKDKEQLTRERKNIGKLAEEKKKRRKERKKDRRKNKCDKQ